MKKIITFLALSFAICSFSHADETIIETTADSVEQAFHDSYKYVKLGGGIFTTPSMGPSVSFGCRLEEKDHAIDISTNYSGQSRDFIVTIPKALYLKYLTPYECRSFYYGGGLSFGWINQHEQKKSFCGLMGELAVGYDFSRYAKTKIFTELTLTQALVPVSSKNKYTAPVITITCGIGF